MLKFNFKRHANEDENLQTPEVEKSQKSDPNPVAGQLEPEPTPTEQELTVSESDKPDKNEQSNTESEESNDVSRTEAVFAEYAIRFAEQKGIGEKQMLEALELLRELGKAWNDAKPSDIALQAVINAVTFDAEVARAFEAGEKQGRESSLECFIRSETGDGLPHLRNENRNPNPVRRSIFSLARSAR